MLSYKFTSSHLSKHEYILRHPRAPKSAGKSPLHVCTSSFEPRTGPASGKAAVATSTRCCRAAGRFRGRLRTSEALCRAGGESAQPPRRSPLGADPRAAPNALRSSPRSPRRVTHRRARARGSSSAPAPRGPGRRRGREAPWAAATGPHSARRRQPRRSAGRSGRGRQGRTRSAGSGGPYSMCPVTAPRRGAEWQMRDPITSHVTGKHRDQHPNLLQRGSAELLFLRLSPASSAAGARFAASTGAPRSPPRRQGRPAVSKAAAQRCPPPRSPASSSAQPRLALLAARCPLAPVHPLQPRRRPARSPSAPRPSRPTGPALALRQPGVPRLLSASRRERAGAARLSSRGTGQEKNASNFTRSRAAAARARPRVRARRLCPSSAVPRRAARCQRRPLPFKASS